MISMIKNLSGKSLMYKCIKIYHFNFLLFQVEDRKEKLIDSHKFHFDAM